MIKPVTAELQQEEILDVIACHGFDVEAQIQVKLTLALAEKFYA